MNASKTKIMICGSGMDELKKSGRYPCGVCFKGVGANSILCSNCNCWVHQRCTEFKKIKEDPSYKCKRCRGEARPIDGRPQESVFVGEDVLDTVASFCYLGDSQSAAGGCSVAAITRVKSAWKKFNELLPILTSRHLSPKTRGSMYYSNVRRVMLYGSETWPITKVDLLRLQRNDRAMIRRICGVRFDQVRTTPSADLLSRLDLFSIESHLRDGRLRWYGHVHRSSGAIKDAFELSVDGRRPPVPPRKTWKDVIADDLSA